MHRADAVSDLPVMPDGPVCARGFSHGDTPVSPCRGQRDRMRVLVELGEALTEAVDKGSPIDLPLMRAATELPAAVVALWIPQTPTGPLRLRAHDDRGTFLIDRVTPWPAGQDPEHYLRAFGCSPGTMRHGQVLWTSDLPRVEGPTAAQGERGLLAELWALHGVGSLAVVPVAPAVPGPAVDGTGARAPGTLPAGSPVVGPGGLLAVGRIVEGKAAGDVPVFGPEELDFLEVLGRYCCSALRLLHLRESPGTSTAALEAIGKERRFAQGVIDAINCRTAVIDVTGTVTWANARWQEDLAKTERCWCAPVPEGENWLEGLADTGEADIDRFADQIRAVLAGTRPLANLECHCGRAGTGSEGGSATAIEVVGLRDIAHRAVVVQSDVTWRWVLQAELAHRVTHDELTGLPNRSALLEQMRVSLRDLERGEHQLAVLFCDLDGFKDINDGRGHTVGDDVLVAVAGRLRAHCPQADIVARFGADEFVIVQPVMTPSQARTLAQRLVESLTEPLPVGGDEIAPGVSIGVTVVDRVPSGNDPAQSLLRDADTALYRAKERGRSRYEIFDVWMRREVSARLEYSAALHRAMGTEQIRLHFQTRRRCGDRTVTGVEALMRWKHPSFGDVPPSTFIPVAERTGRIVQVGGWALRNALRQMTELEDRRLGLAVNVSPRQLSAPGLISMVDSALAVSGLEPWRLTLEITEGALVEDPDQARSVLTSLRRLGVTIALDDFGTGWSSMSYLRTLPVDVLKIDKIFVTDLPRDPDSCAVVSAVLGLGHGMGLVVVAEGVEREDQLDVLRDMGCDEYQGFIDGEPGPLLEVIDLRSGSTGPA